MLRETREGRKGEEPDVRPPEGIALHGSRGSRTTQAAKAWHYSCTTESTCLQSTNGDCVRAYLLSSVIVHVEFLPHGKSQH